MSDYTPTTEEVRNDYLYAWSASDSYDGGEGFNRWLASVKAEAANTERERIIVLLDARGNYYRDGDMWADAAGIDDVIALIEGASNE